MNGRKNKILDVSDRFTAWMELLDFSERLALAGMRTQGLSRRQAWKVWCERWARASKEHQRASRRIVEELRKRDKPLPP